MTRPEPRMLRGLSFSRDRVAEIQTVMGKSMPFNVGERLPWIVGTRTHSLLGALYAANQSGYDGAAPEDFGDKACA